MFIDLSPLDNPYNPLYTFLFFKIIFLQQIICSRIFICSRTLTEHDRMTNDLFIFTFNPCTDLFCQDQKPGAVII